LDRIEAALNASPLPGAASAAGLPGEVGPFIGREPALAEMRYRVSGHETNGVVVAIHAITGMAGVGKTALAVRACHEHAPSYPDGQYFLDLHGYTPGLEPVSPLEALEELLRQAGLPAQAVPAGLAGRQATWRRMMANQRTIVVLDNALDAHQVRPLLPMTPGSLVLITSRSRLPGLTEATPLALDVLTLPEAAALLVAVAGPGRCQHNDAVDAVVLAAGRLPLAIRIAAGRLRTDPTITVAALAAELADTRRRLDELSPEHAGVRAALAASADLLDPAHRLLLWAAGLHPGPTLVPGAVAALASIPVLQATRMLRDLADLNLFDPVAGDGQAHRFQLHDLVRDYARELASTHLTPAEHRTALDRLGEVYRQLAENASWLDVAGERDNVVAFVQGRSDAAAMAIGLGLGRRLHLIDYYGHAVAMFLQAHAVYGSAGDCVGRANASIGLGEVALVTGDHSTARAHFQSAADDFVSAGEMAGQARALRGLGDVARAISDYRAARGYLRASVDISLAVGDDAGRAATLSCLGKAGLATGDYATAHDHFHTANELFIHLGDEYGQADCSLGFGQVAGATHDYPIACGHFQTATRLFDVIGDRAGLAESQRCLGEVALAAGDHATARDHLQAANDQFDAIGDRPGQANARRGLGHAAMASGDLPTARDHFQTASELFTILGDRLGQADALWGLGLAAKHSADSKLVNQMWSQALALYETIEVPAAATVRAALAQLRSQPDERNWTD
jgi:tetratricopeptide (TPR) repeat protein